MSNFQRSPLPVSQEHPPQLSTSTRPSWDDRVGVILTRVNRQSKIYMSLGFGVYGVGSIVLMYLMRSNPGLATAAVMFFFQLCVIFFATTAIFPCISGAFRVGLEANRDTIPAMTELQDAIHEVRQEKDSFISEIKQASLDIREEGRKIREELSKLTRPIEPPPRRIVAPGGSNGEREAVKAADSSDPGAIRRA